MKNPMYNEFAREYEKAISDNIYNANLERPSLISMLPELKGKLVLDLGCGPGFYAKHLVDAGAKVTAIDASSKMVDIVRKKLGSKINCYVQDLSCGLPTENNNSYDLVICPLTIHYIDDLTKLFNDIRCVLKGNGTFIFSTHHPLVDFTASPSGNYFKKELIAETWDTLGHPVEVKFYRRSLTDLFGAISSSGMCVDDLYEGKPTEHMKELSSECYKKLSIHPNFIFLKCRIRSYEQENK